MNLFDLPRPDFLVSGEKARLIPSVADGNKENRATSILLATMMSVDEFGKDMLSMLGARVGKTSKIQCFTEVVFKGDTTKKDRPDGLIIVKTGNKEWRAIVESKISKAELEQAQVESYLDLCKTHSIDAIVTISNQLVAHSTHHPLQFNKVKARNIEIHHWSWMQLLTEAFLWSKHYSVGDPNQAYILTEFVRYLQHDTSGVLPFERMIGPWKEVCTTIQTGMPMGKNSSDALECVNSWHQLVCGLSLQLSIAIGRTVKTQMPRDHKADPQKRSHDDCIALTTQHKLQAVLEVPDAASHIKLCADIKSRTVSCSMTLQAPQDKVRASSRIHWLFNQIKNCADDSLIVKVSWPSRAEDTFATLGALRLNQDVALSDKTDLAPSEFEIVMTRDLMARFKGAATFVQDSQELLLEFYNKVGQNLHAWVASPPKLSISEPNKVIDGVVDAQTVTEIDMPALVPQMPDQATGSEG